MRCWSMPWRPAVLRGTRTGRYGNDHGGERASSPSGLVHRSSGKQPPGTTATADKLWDRCTDRGVDNCSSPISAHSSPGRTPAAAPRRTPCPLPLLGYRLTPPRRLIRERVVGYRHLHDARLPATTRRPDRWRRSARPPTRRFTWRGRALNRHTATTRADPTSSAMSISCSAVSTASSSPRIRPGLTRASVGKFRGHLDEGGCMETSASVGRSSRQPTRPCVAAPAAAPTARGRA